MIMEITIAITFNLLALAVVLRIPRIYGKEVWNILIMILAYLSIMEAACMLIDMFRSDVPRLYFVFFVTFLMSVPVITTGIVVRFHKDDPRYVLMSIISLILTLTVCENIYVLRYKVVHSALVVSAAVVYILVSHGRKKHIKIMSTILFGAILFLIGVSFDEMMWSIAYDYELIVFVLSLGVGYISARISNTYKLER